jgi:hypothetical protein
MPPFQANDSIDQANVTACIILIQNDPFFSFDIQNIKLHWLMKPLNIKGHDIARTKMNLNDDDAMEFVSSIHELNDHRFENLVTKEFLNEKFNDINSRFNSLESSFEKKFNGIDLRFTKVESTINTQMAETRFELLKWMFIACVFQVNILIFILLLIKI